MVNTYKDLIVWNKAIELVALVYELTEAFPKEEIYGITSQMRRAAVSIPSNIAEGRLRGTRKDFAHFLRMAYGSGAELETQIIICGRLKKTKAVSFSKAVTILEEVMRMLNTMIGKLEIDQKLPKS